MDIYYLSNLIDGVRLGDERIAELLNAFSDCISRTGVMSYDDYIGLVYEISLNMPTRTTDEKMATALVLKLLLNNREAIMGLCKQNRHVDIDIIQNRLVAIVF